MLTVDKTEFGADPTFNQSAIAGAAKVLARATPGALRAIDQLRSELREARAVAPSEDAMRAAPDPRQSVAAAWENHWGRFSFSKVCESADGRSLRATLAQHSTGGWEQFLLDGIGLTAAEFRITEQAIERNRIRKLADTKCGLSLPQILKWYQQTLTPLLETARKTDDSKDWGRLSNESMIQPRETDPSAECKMSRAFLNRFSPARLTGSRGGGSLYNALEHFRTLCEGGHIPDPSRFVLVTEQDIRKIKDASSEGRRVANTRPDTSKDEIDAWEAGIRKIAEECRRTESVNPDVWGRLSAANLRGRVPERYSRMHNGHKGNQLGVLQMRGVLSEAEVGRIYHTTRSIAYRTEVDFSKTHIHRLLEEATTFNDPALLTASKVEALSPSLFGIFCSRFGTSNNSWENARNAYLKTNPVRSDLAATGPAPTADAGRSKLTELLRGDLTAEKLAALNPSQHVGDRNVLMFIRETLGSARAHYSDLPVALVRAQLCDVNTAFEIAAVDVHRQRQRRSSEETTGPRRTHSAGPELLQSDAFSGIPILSVLSDPSQVELGSGKAIRTTGFAANAVPIEKGRLTPSARASIEANLAREAGSPDQWDVAAKYLASARDDLSSTLATTAAVYFLIRHFTSQPAQFPKTINSLASGAGTFHEIVERAKPHFESAGIQPPSVVDVDFSPEAVALSKNPRKHVAAVSKLRELPLEGGGFECGPLNSLKPEELSSVLSYLTEKAAPGAVVILRSGTAHCSSELIQFLKSAGFEFVVPPNSRFSLSSMDSADQTTAERAQHAIARQLFTIAVRAELKNLDAIPKASKLLIRGIDTLSVSDGAPEMSDPESSDSKAASALRKFATRVWNLDSEQQVSQRHMVARLLDGYLRAVMTSEDLRGIKSPDNDNLPDFAGQIRTFCLREVSGLRDLWRAQSALPDEKRPEWTRRPMKRDPLVSMLNSYGKIAKWIEKSASSDTSAPGAE